MKTFLVALYCCIRCILYPGTKIIVTSSTTKQSKELISKITDIFMHNSQILVSEISRYSIGQNECGVWFKNGSWIETRVASDNARGARANIVIFDERRLIPDSIIDKVFKPMLTSPRQPGYLSKPEYAHLQEMNKQISMSSAWYKQSELFELVKGYTANTLNDKLKYFICDLPYQLSIKENLLMPELIINEMSESTFSDITFAIEREGTFWGASSDAFFQFNILNDRRILTDSLHDLEYYRVTNTKIPQKKPGELRILSVDVALLASKKHQNDASAICIGDAVPTSSNSYITNVPYMETKEDLKTEELGLMIMRYFYNYYIDYIALDANGIGQSVLDYLMDDRFDTDYNMSYGALNVCNNDDLASRCKIKSAPKVIFAFKGDAKKNNTWCINLRAGFMNGNINLLKSDTDIDEYLSENVDKYNKLTEYQKARLKLPYIQTTLAIDELINLEYEYGANNLIKIKERSGMRKDRYSSLEYLYAAVTELALQLKGSNKPKDNNYERIFKVRPPIYGNYLRQGVGR